MTTLELCPAQHEEAFTERTPEGLIVMAPNGQLYRFNGLADFIWTRLNGHTSVQEIIDAICAQYQVPSVEQVTADVVQFIAFLREKALIRAEAGEGGADWPGS